MSHLLLGPGDGHPLAVTWVDCAPGSQQPAHVHAAQEQIYVVVRGRGLMHVGDEGTEVSSGTMIVIPPGQPHRIQSIGDEPLTYVSATVPPFDLPAADSELGYR